MTTFTTDLATLEGMSVGSDSEVREDEAGLIIAMVVQKIDENLLIKKSSREAVSRFKSAVGSVLWIRQTTDKR